MQTLERELGVPMFVRLQSGVRLTTAGRLILGRVREFVSQLEDSTRQARALAREVISRIRIGILSSIARGFLRELLERHLSEHSTVTLQVFEGSPSDNVANVRSGQLDVAFIVDGAEITDCDTLQLWTERLYVALPSKHSLAKSRQVPWSTLRSEQFILRESERGPILCDTVLQKLSGPSDEPAIQKFDVSREALMHLVAIGLGVSLTSEATVGLKFPGVVFRPIAGGDQVIQFSAVWLRNNRNPALTTFLRLAERLAKRTRQRANAAAKKTAHTYPRSVRSRGFWLSRRDRKKARSAAMKRASIGAIRFRGSTEQPVSRPRISA
jgi:DNA-binding transcriptional LysR family regulator